MISIDPGVHEYGWASWSGKILVACGVAKTKESWRPRDPEPDRWVCEYPEQRGRLSPVKMQVLIELARSAGCIVGNRPCEWFRPSQWKGTIDKNSHHNAMFEVLSSAEHERLEAGSKGCTKDTILDLNDAVCLGLWRLGRLA